MVSLHLWVSSHCMSLRAATRFTPLSNRSIFPIISCRHCATIQRRWGAKGKARRQAGTNGFYKKTNKKKTENGITMARWVYFFIKMFKGNCSERKKKKQMRRIIHSRKTIKWDFSWNNWIEIWLTPLICKIQKIAVYSFITPTYASMNPTHHSPNTHYALQIKIHDILHKSASIYLHV